MTETAPPPTRRPGLRDVYILTAGILLGVLLGPAVLGRVAPDTYAKLLGGGAARQQWLDYQEETGALHAALQATGVTPDAVAEQDAARRPHAKALYGAMNALMDRRAARLLTTVAAALALCLFVEAVGGRVNAITLTSRYALAGLALALLVARPSLWLA